MKHSEEVLLASLMVYWLHHYNYVLGKPLQGPLLNAYTFERGLCSPRQPEPRTTSKPW
jgi:hypothetical protein